MSMNKAERQDMADLRARLACAMALRWTEPVEPDVEPPGGGWEHRVGWRVLSAQTTWHMPCPALTDSVNSSVGDPHDKSFPVKTTSQGTLRLHSTRLAALRAVRHSLEEAAARELDRIDDEIERETRAPTTMAKAPGKGTKEADPT